MTTQVEVFLDGLFDTDPVSHRLVNQTILVLERNGPAEGRRLRGHGDRVANSQHEGTAAAVGWAERGPDLLVFDPWRSAVLLVAGDKSGQWSQWCRTAIPQAEKLYADYLAEREKEMGR